jgi:flagellar protein FlaF
MQNIMTDIPFRAPNGAANAYGAVIRHTESARDIEYRVFERITAALEDALPAETHFTQRIIAVHDNRALWQTLAHDLAGDDNGLPDQLRANLIGLAIWVTRESDRVISQSASLRDLININHTIMTGLRPAAREAN